MRNGNLSCAGQYVYLARLGSRGYGGTGRRTGLKILRGQPRAGSIPATRTNFEGKPQFINLQKIYRHNERPTL